MSDATSRGPGPGAGAGGVPAAIALTPILAARYRARDVEAIRAAAPGAGIVTIGFDGHPDGALDDVEVMLRGRLPADTFDRILARAPALRWVHSATAGVERVLTPASRDRGLIDHQRPRRVLAPDRRVRDADDPGGVAAPAPAAGAAGRAHVAAARVARSCAT